MELASAGCRVILCSRDVQAGKAAVVHSMHHIDTSGNPVAEQDIVVHQLDLADLDSVEALVSTVRSNEKRLDFLILNAGVLATPLGYTKQVALPMLPQAPTMMLTPRPGSKQAHRIASSADATLRGNQIYRLL